MKVPRSASKCCCCGMALDILVRVGKDDDQEAIGGVTGRWYRASCPNRLSCAPRTQAGRGLVLAHHVYHMAGRCSRNFQCSGIIQAFFPSIVMHNHLSQSPRISMLRGRGHPNVHWVSNLSQDLRRYPNKTLFGRDLGLRTLGEASVNRKNLY